MHSQLQNQQLISIHIPGKGVRPGSLLHNGRQAYPVERHGSTPGSFPIIAGSISLISLKPPPSTKHFLWQLTHPIACDVFFLAWDRLVKAKLSLVLLGTIDGSLNRITNTLDLQTYTCITNLPHLYSVCGLSGQPTSGQQ